MRQMWKKGRGLVTITVSSESEGKGPTATTRESVHQNEEGPLGMTLEAVDIDVLETLEDEALAQRAAEDFDSFAELYRRYLCPIYRFVRSQVTDDATAEDLTAQVFFKALSSAATYRGDGTYQSWVFRIAHNCVASWRTSSSKVVVVLEQVPESEDPEPTPAALAIVDEERSFIRQKVEALPPAQREVVALRYLQDFTIEEIAKVTRRTRGAVRILLHRARSRLRRDLEGKELA
jgi:RNA polymerase sigma-70 factor, ECF subfamily